MSPRRPIRSARRAAGGGDHPSATGRFKTPLPLRVLLFSLASHIALALVVQWNPTLPRRTALPAVVTVDLVAALPSAAAPRAESQPAPQPKPPPKPPPKKKVLPTQEMQREPKKPKPKPKPKPKAKAKPDPPPEEQVEPDLADVLADLRRQEGTPTPSPATERRPGARPDARGSGIGERISPEEAAWRRRAKLHVTRNWVLPPGFRRQLLEAEVHVKLAAGGNVQDVEVVRRSGNPWFDESVERAIRKSDPLPAPERFGTWVFVFRPEDVF